MTKQLKGKKPVQINAEFLEAFEVCKTLLTNDPILKYPEFDKPFILTTDASNFAIGAVLSQGSLNNDKPTCYASRTLSDAEVNYSTIEKEMLAIIWAVKHVRPYLYGKKFTIVTDHKPLTWLMYFKEPSSKILRWRIQLMEYDFDIIYRKGSQNVIADALSRIDHEVHTNEVGATDIATNTITNIQIPITEKPLNDFNLQIVLQGGQITEQKIIIPFKNKLRKYFRETTFTKENVERILKATLKPKKIYAIFTTDDIFEIVQEVYARNFPQDKTFTLVRSLELLPEEKDKAKQEEMIK